MRSCVFHGNKIVCGGHVNIKSSRSPDRRPIARSSESSQPDPLQRWPTHTQHLTYRDGRPQLRLVRHTARPVRPRAARGQRSCCPQELVARGVAFLRVGEPERLWLGDKCGEFGSWWVARSKKVKSQYGHNPPTSSTAMLGSFGPSVFFVVVVVVVPPPPRFVKVPSILAGCVDAAPAPTDSC